MTAPKTVAAFVAEVAAAPGGSYDLSAGSMTPNGRRARREAVRLGLVIGDVRNGRIFNAAVTKRAAQ